MDTPIKDIEMDKCIPFLLRKITLKGGVHQQATLEKISKADDPVADVREWCTESIAALQEFVDLHPVE